MLFLEDLFLLIYSVMTFKGDPSVSDAVTRYFLLLLSFLDMSIDGAKVKYAPQAYMSTGR